MAGELPGDEKGVVVEQEIVSQFKAHADVLAEAERLLAAPIARMVDLLVEALGTGKKLLVMGNGGSAADAQHFAAEIVGRFILERKGLPALALTTDSSILSAIGNDYGFDLIFRRQVEALAAPGDVVIGISTSGSSKNVLCALQLAKEMGCHTVGLVGGDGGPIAGLVDLPLVVPTRATPRIQECHITIIHIVCGLVEQRLFPQVETGR